MGLIGSLGQKPRRRYEHGEARGRLTPDESDTIWKRNENEGAILSGREFRSANGKDTRICQLK